MKIIFVFTALLTLSIHASADTLFEGWYRVLSAGQHVGYVVQRYEVNPKTKVFTSTYYLKTNAFGNEVTEGVRAQASENLSPISYQYTSKVGKKSKVIDAVFEGEVPAKKPGKAKSKLPNQPDGLRLVATVIEDGKTQKIDRKIPQGSFLSTFLVYLMLQNKEGIKVGTKYDYNGIAEEDADVYKGTAFVKEVVKQNGIDVFKVLNTFKDIQFINHITTKGETTYTKTPTLHIVTELTSTPEEARKNVPLDEKSIKLLFGNIPGAGTLASSPLAKADFSAAPAKPAEVAKPTQEKATTAE